MVFQYNPLENYIEINDRGEAVVTVNNSSVLSPKLRYNVGDEGQHDAPGPPAAALRPRRLETAGRFRQGWAAPFFFLYGRRDSDDLVHGREHLSDRRRVRPVRDERLAAAIESFCLELEETPDAGSRPVVHVQLRKGAAVEAGESAAERLRRRSSST